MRSDTYNQASVKSKNPKSHDFTKLGYWQLCPVKKVFIFNDVFYETLKTSFEKVGTYTLSFKAFSKLFVRPQNRYILKNEVDVLSKLNQDYYHSTVELPVIFGNKEDGHIRVSINYIKNEDTNDVEIYGHCQDITNYKVLEKKLLYSEIRFKALVENSSEAMGILNAQGKAIYMSSSFKNILGYSDEEIKSIGMADIVHPDHEEEVFERFNKSLSMPDAQIYKPVSKWRHRNGHWIWLEGTFTNKLHDPVIGGIIDNFRNVSDIVNYQNKLKSLLKRSREQNETLKNFTFIVSHHIRAAVVNILGLSELIKDSTGEDEMVDLLLCSANRLDKSIKNVNDLLQFLKTKSSSKKQPYNLYKLTTGIIKSQDSLINKKGVIIKNNIDKNLNVHCYPKQLETVLRNLIINAIQFGITEDSKVIEIFTQVKENKVLFSIKDFGPGIHDKFRDNIFKIGKQYSHEDPGLGIGLHICKTFLKNIDAKIVYDSDYHDGAKFDIIFKIKPNEKDSINR